MSEHEPASWLEAEVVASAFARPLATFERWVLLALYLGAVVVTLTVLLMVIGGIVP